MSDNRAQTKAEARRIVSLAWPIMLTSLNWTLMHMIDVMVVGHFGTGQLAALIANREQLGDAVRKRRDPLLFHRAH